MENKFNYQLSFRLLNFIVSKKILLAENFALINLSGPELNKKYPINERLTSIPSNFRIHWNKHTTEIVFDLIETSIKEISSIEIEHYYKNIIRKTFMLADLKKPAFTHTLIYSDNPPKNALGIQGISNYQYIPTLLSKDNIKSLIEAYNLIKEVENDNILNAALNQLTIARNKGNHNINKINSPNWDKIVNYVTALEILLLNNIDGELTYRFKLNGTSLLSKIETKEKRIIFKSLGELYKLRSIVVHGGNENKILPRIAKIVNYLEIDDDEHTHPIGQLMLLNNQLDLWIYKILQFAIQLKIEERPFSNSELWEDWLWD